MAHLNIYLPDDVAAALKREANAAGVPLSRFILSRGTGNRPGDHWPEGFFELSCGFLAENIEEPADAPAEPVEALNLP